MFCVKCGKYNPDTKKQCAYCGGELTTVNPNPNPNVRTYKDIMYKTQKKEPRQSSSPDNKTLAGVLLCLFLGVIGLIIGLLLYPDGEKRRSFLKAWVVTIIVEVIILVIVLVLCLALAVSLV